MKPFTYDVARSCAFRFTREKYGEFSNFALLPLRTNEGTVPTSEHLYQMAKFLPGSPARTAVRDAPTPKEAKRIAQTRIKDGQGRWTANEWNENRVWIMEFILRLKLKQHRTVLEPLLRETSGKSIVEISKHDQFWGAEPRFGTRTLVGYNQLGRLWEVIRDEMLATT